MTDEPLPSSFDLWFDIKTREHLVRYYAATKQELANLDMVMASHGIEFTEEEMSVIDPEVSQEAAPAAPKPF